MLTVGEKLALQTLIMRLLEANEPGAMLGVLRRIAERRALEGSRNLIAASREDTLRWYAVVKAITKVQETVKADETDCAQSDVPQFYDGSNP